MPEKYTQKKRGERGGFRRLGITMPPELIQELKITSALLQEQGHKDVDVSSIVRMACYEFLKNI